jgi:hypothetical protein
VKLYAALVAVVVALALPDGAVACDSCLAATNSTVQWAFMIASIFLSVTPLAIVGAFVWWLVRRARRLAAEESSGVVHLPPVPARAARRS